MPSPKKTPTAVVAAQVLREGAFDDEVRRSAFAKLIDCAPSYVTKLINAGTLNADCLTDDERFVITRPALEAIIASDPQVAHLLERDAQASQAAADAPSLPLASHDSAEGDKGRPALNLTVSPAEEGRARATATATNRRATAQADREALKLAREQVEFERDMQRLVEREAVESVLYQAAAGLKQRLASLVRKRQAELAQQADAFTLGDLLQSYIDRELDQFGADLAAAASGGGDDTSG